jgi:hypothetical protein
MKKIFQAALLFALSLTNSYGQWYFKEYGVSDINGLSKEQLETSLGDTRTALLAAGGITVIGGLLILAGNITLKHGLDEDATILEEILGAEFMGKTYLVLGTGSVAGGVVTGLVFFIRHERIKSVMNRNYGFEATLNISPSVITTGITRSSALGMTVTIEF